MRNRIFNRVAIIALASFICYIFIVEFESCSNKSAPKFTIGTTISTKWTLSSGQLIYYEYNYRNVLYTANNIYKDRCTIGGRYFVEFKPDLAHSEHLLEDAPVPDSIKAAPPNGWKLEDIIIGRTKAEIKDMLGDNGNLLVSNQWEYVVEGIYNGGRGIITVHFKDGKVDSYKVRSA